MQYDKAKAIELIRETQEGAPVIMGKPAASIGEALGILFATAVHGAESYAALEVHLGFIADQCADAHTGMILEADLDALDEAAA